MMKTTLATLALALLVPATANAVTYFGENQNPANTVSGNPVTARNNFASQLSGTSTEDFEGFATGSSPASLSFTGSAGPINAAFSPGGGSILNGVSGAGRFPTSGTQSFEVTDANFGISFSTAIAAFGFYATDIGDFNGQLTLTLLRNALPDQVINIPHTINGASGSLLFFGVIDTANPFNGVRFGNTAPGVDFFGFDDMIVGDVRQVTGGVPEPSTWALMLLGFGMVGAGMRRRQKVAVRYAF